MFAYYIAKATENFGLPATRPIYEKAIKSLPNNQTAEMCMRFANLEQKLGEIDRARASTFFLLSSHLPSSHPSLR